MVVDSSMIQQQQQKMNIILDTESMEMSGLGTKRGKQAKEKYIQAIHRDHDCNDKSPGFTIHVCSTTVPCDDTFTGSDKWIQSIQDHYLLNYNLTPACKAVGLSVDHFFGDQFYQIIVCFVADNGQMCNNNKIKVYCMSCFRFTFQNVT